MDIREGAARMQRAGRWMILIPGVLLIILVCAAICAADVESYFRQDLRYLFGLVPIFTPLFILGILLWLAGWIVEGFGKSTS